MDRAVIALCGASVASLVSGASVPTDQSGLRAENVRLDQAEIVPSGPVGIVPPGRVENALFARTDRGRNSGLAGPAEAFTLRANSRSGLRFERSFRAVGQTIHHHRLTEPG